MLFVLLSQTGSLRFAVLALLALRLHGVRAAFGSAIARVIGGIEWVGVLPHYAYPTVCFKAVIDLPTEVLEGSHPCDPY